MKKIAVLGGGTGSLSAVYGLMQTPNWQDNYDITVYQLGWRLGGKGASGRNKDREQRIEEHGVHIWFGFYDNAFKLIQKCYEEMGRPAGSPLATWDEAFKPHNFVTLKDFHDDQWENWPVDFPVTPGTPGVGGRQWWPLKFVEELSSWVNSHRDDIFGASSAEYGKIKISEKAKSIAKSSGLQSSTDDPLDLVQHLLKVVNEQQPALQTVEQGETRITVDEILVLLRELQSALHAAFVLDLIPRRTFILADLALAISIGILADSIWLDGFYVIDNVDLRAWLDGHGALNITVYSAPVRAFYDLVFSYPNGDTGPDNPSTSGNTAAGSALYAILLILFAYKGAVMWKMLAGMGDVIFTPIYDVLKKQGVKFKFFHKVTDLIPNAAGDAIEEIIVNEQVTLKDPTTEYQPLVDVKGLPCWPSEPIYDQIEQGGELQANSINLESYWTPWVDVNPNISLKVGEDFDEVICGIPISALELISKQLAAKSESWNTMVTNVTSVRTLALQNWFEPNLADLGWPLQTTILTAYSENFDTWADMSQVIPVEDWQQSDVVPQNIAYFCGPMKDEDPDNPIPPPSEHDYPQQKADEIHDEALSWLDSNLYGLFPNIANQSGVTNWDAFIDPEGRSGVARFEAQYWRANIDPTERYTLSSSDTNQYRLTTNGSDFKNLYIAGDWIDNKFIKTGCIESTVVAGLQAAEAISGVDLGIVY